MLKALNNIKMKGISAKISKLRLKMETLEAQAKQKQEELEAIQAKLNFHIGFCSTPIPIPPDYKTNPEASKRYGLKKSEQFQVQQLIKEEISAEALKQFCISGVDVHIWLPPKLPSIEGGRVRHAGLTAPEFCVVM